MIKIIIVRNGFVEGVSIIPTKNVHNPYFLFGAECSKENQDKLALHIEYANKHKKLNSQIPDYCYRVLLMWQDLGFKFPLSFPEIGLLNDAQSWLAYVFTSIHLSNVEIELEIRTTSECMVRCFQFLVASNVLKNENIAVYDTVIDEPNKIINIMEFQVQNEFTVTKL